METMVVRPRLLGIRSMLGALAGGELDQLKALTDEQLKNFYSVIVLSVAYRAKCAYMAELGSLLAKDPELLANSRSTPEGEKFVSALKAAQDYFLKMTDPTLMRVLQETQSAIEINILPKRGYNVRGRLPIYRAGQAKLDYSDVRVDVPPGVAVLGTVDFGDVSDTLLISDYDALVLAARAIGAKTPGLGIEPATIIIGGIALITVIVSLAISVTWVIREAKSVPPVPEIPPGAPPALRDAILEKWAKSASFVEQVAGVIKWVAISGGIAVVGGGILFLIFKK